MTTTTRGAIVPYEFAENDGLFKVLMGFYSYCVMWDAVFAQALARLPYVRATHLVPPTSEAFPYELVVSVDGDLTWARIEEMQATVDAAYATNGA